MNEERQEVFRGHFEECLDHFSDRVNSKIPRASKRARQTRKPIEVFCGVGPEAVADWLSNRKRYPVGESLIKLTCYLDMHGYRIIEFERLGKNSQAMRGFAELIGFGILPAKTAAELIGYQKHSSLYEVFRLKDGYGLSKQKEELMWQIWKERKDELERKKKEAFETYRLKFLFEPVPIPILMRGGEQTVVNPDTASKLASKRQAVIYITRGLLELLKEELFDNLSESDRADIENADVLRILQLSSLLGNLSSKLIRIGEV